MQNQAKSFAKAQARDAEISQGAKTIQVDQPRATLSAVP
jgi:hypothetical protein